MKREKESRNVNENAVTGNGYTCVAWSLRTNGHGGAILQMTMPVEAKCGSMGQKDDMNVYARECTH